jgi:hypothetical protein
MFPVYSVTYVPGPYPVLRSLALLDVLQRVRLRGPRSQALPGRRLRRLAATRREKCGLAARGKSPAGRVASAVGPDARRADRGDAGSSSRRRYTADGSTPPQPKGRQWFAAAGRRYSSSPMSRHRLLLVPCQRPQIPGARLHATFTTGCYPPHCLKPVGENGKLGCRALHT